MADSYIEWRKREHVRPMLLPNKEQYYIDLLNIEHSWSGRLDTNIGNTFVMEAEQQLVNAIELFEQGYFDCAYYSLRSAVDMSTTMVFLADMPDSERDNYLEAWKSTMDFPMQGQMIKELSRNGSVFTDMLEKMPEFFSNSKKLSAELNKYVHKQGLQHFYVSRNHLMNQEKSQAPFIEIFEKYLQRCIGVVAVMRLAIDPFPILLMDEEILYRCFDSMTDPYSDEFVDKYIGTSTIERYKRTEMYIATYDSFISEEKKNDAVFNVMKYQYIDSRRLDEIFSQLHLLPKDDIISVLLVAADEKVIKVYCHNCFLRYFTDKESNRKAMSWSGLDFKKFSEAKNPMNQIYDESYISVYYFGDTFYFVEHNELLSEVEVNRIAEFVVEGLNTLKIENGTDI
ncbi:MAG: teicoplanin resistance protein VanZ [Clostridia bacterium]|nr:teicoplanin resistance protein VanZ [Clostridia bacterium]